MYQPVLRARYAIYGSMIGDALGVTVEFMKMNAAKRILALHDNFAKGLVGGGPFNWAPGQFSDDNEIGLSVMSVIVKNGKYDQELVAKAYHDWYLSDPPDIGNATRAAFSQKTAKEMISIGKTININSLSNGFLMRLPGLIALYYKKSKEELLEAIIKDVELTHGHPEAKNIACTYAEMLHGAINGMSAREVYELGFVRAKNSPLLTAIYGAVERNEKSFKYDDRVCEFKNIDGPQCGFVGYAFWLLLLCLRQYKSYKNAMLEIAEMGSDADTNCMIVGAIMGALYCDTLPRIWIESVRNFSAPERFNAYPIANPKVWIKWLPY